MCCVVVCDLETSRMGAPYIYDISSLRVNNIFQTKDMEAKRNHILFVSVLQTTSSPSQYNIRSQVSSGSCRLYPAPGRYDV